ncbi:MAG: trypsin-like peptidase domain-containing protein [Candidatus Rokuibacteriota bacterium]
MGGRVGRVSGTITRCLILSLIMAGCAPRGGPTRDEIFQRILPATVQVVVEQQEGRRLRTSSGVAMASRGTACFILTSGHAMKGVQGQRQVYVVFGRHRGEGLGQKAPATLLASRDTGKLDLAILRADSDACAPTGLGPPPSLGESVWVVGFPWGQHMTLASGVVSQINSPAAGSIETAARLMVDASVSYGSSGGGVFEARGGGLIGLVEGYRTARVTSHGTAGEWYIDVPEPGQTFVTSLADIRRFLAETGHARLLESRPSHPEAEGITAEPQPARHP